MSISCDLQCCDDNENCATRDILLNRPLFIVVTQSEVFGTFLVESEAITWAKKHIVYGYSIRELIEPHWQALN